MNSIGEFATAASTAVASPVNLTVAALTAGGVAVDLTGSYRYTGGVCYVLLASGGAGTADAVTVVCAVPVGDDLDAFRTFVMAALAEAGDTTPVSWSAAYGAEPVPGRGMPDADIVEIEVLTAARPRYR